MEWRVAAAFAICLVGSGCCLAGSIIGLQMVEAVNTRLPKEERFEEIGWHFLKTVRLLKTYRDMYPYGTLLHRFYLLSATGLASFVTATTLLGFPVAMVVCMGCIVSVLFWLLIRLSA
jgi:hypothetical protein